MLPFAAIMSGRTRVLGHAGAVFRQPHSPRALRLASRTTPVWRTVASGSRPHYGGGDISSRPTRKRYYSSPSSLVDPPANIRPIRVYTTGYLVDVVVQRPNSLGAQDILSLPKLWLRDICPCPQCQSPASGQKKFATTDLDFGVTPKSIELKQDGSLRIEWSDAHSSVYPLEYYTSRHKLSIGNQKPTMPERSIWDRATFKRGLESRNVEYTDWMEGGPAFSQALKNLASYGLVVVKNVPEADTSVQNVGERIGPLMDTFYGRTWDVISKPDAENVAYTSEFLPLHQDLLYHDPVPKLQLLHCLKNECSGGDSLFSDGILAFWGILLADTHEKRQISRIVNTLTTEVLAYWYTKNGNDRYRTHPVFQTLRTPTLPIEVNWSPPFQAPLPLDPFLQHLPRREEIYQTEEGPPTVLWMEYMTEGMRMFRDWIEAPENMWQYKMKSGDCVVFDNRRILHGRTQFEPSEGGQRHLRGAYLDQATWDRVRKQHVGDGVSLWNGIARKEYILSEREQANEIMKKTQWTEGP